MHKEYWIRTHLDSLYSDTFYYCLVVRESEIRIASSNCNLYASHLPIDNAQFQEEEGA